MGSTLQLDGTFAYRTDGETLVNVERELGWCEHCATFVPMEKLCTREDIIEQLKTLDDLANTLDTLTAAAHVHRPLWRDVLGIKATDTPSIQHLKAEGMALEKRADQMIKANKATQGRENDPRCLMCGGHAVHAVQIPRSAISEHRQQHPDPGCDGQLTLHPSKNLANSLPRVRVYDASGTLLHAITDQIA